MIRSLGPLLALLLLAVPCAAARADALLAHGEFRLDPERSETPPTDEAGWQPVSLPHAWSGAGFEPGRRSDAWYRFRLPPAPPGDERLALYLPRLILNGAVFLNGRWLGQCGRFEPPLARCWNHPLLVEFPRASIAAGENVVHVRLAGYPPFAVLAPLRFGTAAELAPRHRWRSLLQAGVARAAAAFGLMILMFMLALWIGTRDPVYGAFAVAVGIWEVNELNFYWVEPPLPHWVFEWAIHVALDALAVCIVVFVHRYFGLARPRFERALFGFAGLSAVATALSIPSSFHLVTVALHAVSVGVVVYTAVLSIGRLPQLSAGERVPWIWFLGVTVLVAGLDLLAQAGLRDFASPRYFPYLVPAMTLFVGTGLTVRFLRQFARARNMNVELEQRVREKHAELEANFQRMRELEAGRVLADERERIMREVHDGLGGQLVSTLSMVEGGAVSKREIADAIRASLDDMYLVIHSLDPLVDEISTLLGMVRGRIESRLLRQGLRFEWDVKDMPEIPRLGSHELLHVLRIVQEALTNILKHAEARVVRVSTGARDGRDGSRGAFIEIRDDGVGPGREPGDGRGLANMRQRASQIRAELSVEAAGPGMRVALWIPVEADGRL